MSFGAHSQIFIWLFSEMLLYLAGSSDKEVMTGNEDFYG